MNPSTTSIYELKDFGKVILHVKEAMDNKGITRNKMASLTGIKYDIVTKYYRGHEVERVDLVILAKLCYVLDCSVSDLLEYSKPIE